MHACMHGDRMKGISDKDYQKCVDNLGLLEGETIRLEYVCMRNTWVKSNFRETGQKEEIHRGLLVLTNDNLIFMQKEGVFNARYGQALHIPLESILGTYIGGVLQKHLKIKTDIEELQFSLFKNVKAQEAREAIEKLLKTAREEKKKIALEAREQGKMPTMIFCKYCGARNKTTETHCKNCGGLL